MKQLKMTASANKAIIAGLSSISATVRETAIEWLLMTINILLGRSFGLYKSNDQVECKFYGYELTPNDLAIIKEIVELLNFRLDSSHRNQVWETCKTHREFDTIALGVEQINSEEEDDVVLIDHLHELGWGTLRVKFFPANGLAVRYREAVR